MPLLALYLRAVGNHTKVFFGGWVVTLVGYGTQLRGLLPHEPWWLWGIAGTMVVQALAWNDARAERDSFQAALEERSAFPRSLIRVDPSAYVDTDHCGRVLFFKLSITNQEHDRRIALDLTLRLHWAVFMGDDWREGRDPEGEKLYERAVGHPEALSQPVSLGPGKIRDGLLIVGWGWGEDMFLKFSPHGEDYGVFDPQSDPVVRGRITLSVFDRVSGATNVYPVEFKERGRSSIPAPEDWKDANRALASAIQNGEEIRERYFDVFGFRNREQASDPVADDIEGWCEQASGMVTKNHKAAANLFHVPPLHGLDAKNLRTYLDERLAELRAIQEHAS